MGREIILFKSKERKTAAEAAAMLRQAADKLETGTLTLTQSGESLELNIPDGLTLQIKAEEETGKRRKPTTKTPVF